MNLKKLIIFIFIVPSFLFGSVDFDGVDDYLDCGSGLGLEKSAMSVTAWVNPTIEFDPFPRGTVFSHYDDSVGVNLEMYLEDGASIGSYIALGCDMLDSGGNYNTVITDYGDSTGWRHIACIWDGSNLTPYVDGIAGTSIGISDSADTTEGNLTIGIQAGPLYPFYGQITDVNYYQRKVSVSEIETLAFSRMRGDIVPTNSRSGHWPLDDIYDGLTANGKIFLNRAQPGTLNCTGSGGTAYADFIRYH